MLIIGKNQYIDAVNQRNYHVMICIQEVVANNYPISLNDVLTVISIGIAFWALYKSEKAAKNSRVDSYSSLIFNEKVRIVKEILAHTNIIKTSEIFENIEDRSLSDKEDNQVFESLIGLSNLLDKEKKFIDERVLYKLNLGMQELFEHYIYSVENDKFRMKEFLDKLDIIDNEISEMIGIKPLSSESLKIIKEIKHYSDIKKK